MRMRLGRFAVYANVELIIATDADVVWDAYPFIVQNTFFLQFFPRVLIKSVILVYILPNPLFILTVEDVVLFHYSEEEERLAAIAAARKESGNLPRFKGLGESLQIVAFISGRECLDPLTIEKGPHVKIYNSIWQGKRNMGDRTLLLINNLVV